MTITNDNLKADVDKLARIPFLPALLDVVCVATGMGFAAVARVSETHWVAGAVRDDIQFGLIPGGELPLESTICYEIRQNKTPVIIDHVAHDARYYNHHTPTTYGFESYISFPIVRKDGSFFGTLCAIDPKAAVLNTPLMVNLFSILSNLIAEYIDGMQSLSPGNIAKLEMYAAAELRNMRSDMAPHTPETEKSDEKMAQLSMKVNLLLMALDPRGSFLS